MPQFPTHKVVVSILGWSFSFSSDTYAGEILTFIILASGAFVRLEEDLSKRTSQQIGIGLIALCGPWPHPTHKLREREWGRLYCQPVEPEDIITFGVYSWNTCFGRHPVSHHHTGHRLD